MLEASNLVFKFNWSALPSVRLFLLISRTLVGSIPSSIWALQEGDYGRLHLPKMHETTATYPPFDILVMLLLNGRVQFYPLEASRVYASCRLWGICTNPHTKALLPWDHHAETPYWEALSPFAKTKMYLACSTWSSHFSVPGSTTLKLDKRSQAQITLPNTSPTRLTETTSGNKMGVDNEVIVVSFSH